MTRRSDRSEPDPTPSRPGDRSREPVIVDTCTSALWSELVARTPSDVFHAPAWHRVLADAYGFQPRGRVVVDPQGVPVAGLVTCHIDDLRGERIVGLPFSDYCDPLATDEHAWRQLEPSLPVGVPARLRSLRDRSPTLSPTWSSASRAHWHAVDLEAPSETLWQRIDASARRAVRKARKAGVTVRASDAEEDLRTFYAMHLGVRKVKYRLLAQPYRFFEAIHRHFLARGDGTVLLAEHGGEAIGGVLLLSWRDRIYYKFNASRLGELPVRPNDLLMWSSIRHGQERGARTLDLGLSDWDQEGLVRYKRKYASEEGVIVGFERRGGAVDAHHGAAPGAGEMLRALTDLFTDDSVPDQVTARAGDLLYGYFV